MIVKGYATLSPAAGTAGKGHARWDRRAETVRMESETSSVVPRFRRSLEALGELLEDKAFSAWGRRRAEGGRLEASARYTWERRLYDGRMIAGHGEGGGGGDNSSVWQVRHTCTSL